MSMKDEMLAAGYIWDELNWTSPFSGKVTSFQPARQEFMVIRQLKPELLDAVDHERTKKELRDRIRKCSDLGSQVRVYEDALRRIRDSLVAWNDNEASRLLETVGNIATEALARGQAAPQSPRACRDDSCDAVHCPKCGCHKLDWYAKGLCSRCQDALEPGSPGWWDAMLGTGE